VKNKTSPKAPAEKTDIVPVASKSLTRKQAESFQRQQYLRHLPELSEATYTSLILLVKAGDPVAVKLAADVLKLTAKVSPVNVNVSQNVVQGEGDTERKSFAQLVRRLEDRDRQVPPPPVIDIEPDPLEAA
jgi:hypothetical protein